MGAQISRREAMKLAGAATVLAVTRGGLGMEGKEGRAARGGTYALPELPYGYDALEPLYDARTLQVHHTRHHAGYVRGLNATLGRLAKARTAGEYGAIKALSRALAFHGSGHVLHTLFWKSMTPGGSRFPAGLASKLKADFGSTGAAGQQFAAAAKKVEGSGWAVLAYEPMADKLLILQAEKHQNLAVWGVAPLLVCDVWEHAYYLQYKNRRADWVSAFMKLADWNAAAKRLAAARKSLG